MKETIMKIAATLSAIALGLGTAGFAYADSLPYYPADTTANAASTVTRAQVEHALQQAEAQGTLIIGETSSYPVLAQHDNKTRAQVLAELRTAEAAGLVRTGEQASYPGFSA
ncbi:DUF4148 domain-containing protein [Castellaniella hirudinis]|uniref:DUF4148 domain-containing protein n=1 Tax=Castellaniella hirudinis TaxID=1144617 RepID=UPI0039C41A6C